MRSIKVSDAVWEAIAAQGKFGEKEDDVLRRILKLEPAAVVKRSSEGVRGRGNLRYATKVMRARVQGGRLRVAFVDGADRDWKLPDDTSDKEGIRKVRAAAFEFARKHGATDGQIDAVRKALTDAGYHLTK